jgi:hypothetical protein
MSGDSLAIANLSVVSIFLFLQKFNYFVPVEAALVSSRSKNAQHFGFLQ